MPEQGFFISLEKFLRENRTKILSASEKKVISLAALRVTSEELQKGLPIFFDQLVSILLKDGKSVSVDDELAIIETAGDHGKEFLKLGYTLSHVVHAYGAVCQSITGLASTLKAPISALEFHKLNRCLDIAIAGAVSEFESKHNKESKEHEVVHLGVIVHELRNILNRAQIAYQMLAKGVVGLGGSTSKVLERCFVDLDLLINRSLSEVRMRSKSDLLEEYLLIVDLINHLTTTADIEAQRKQQTIVCEIEPGASIKADRHLMLAALGNLVQNAIKYSKNGGKIVIHAYTKGASVFIEIRDECGGISDNNLKKLFKEFSQQHSDRTGLGLGLIITKRAIEKCGGTISVQNIKNGCSFKVKLSKSVPPEKSDTGSVV